MTKVVILKILKTGSWEEGFHVTLQMGEEGNVPSIQAEGDLPSNREIPEYYQEWQSAYRHLPVIARIEAPPQQQTNVSRRQDCSEAARGLVESLNRWLDSEKFRPIKDKLLEYLNREEPIVIFIQTEDFQLRRLPWHLWNFIQQSSQAEVVLSPSNFAEVKTSVPLPNTLRILAILGNSEGIDTESDRQSLRNLPRAKNPLFLVEPPREEITEELWKGGWDILFFAGHSCTVGQQGIISINPTESLNLDELKYGLKLAIKRGLKLAIFNSCDGLGLARKLGELGISQVIVMREPIPDHVAQNFLKYFLAEFSQGQSIYFAVRKARERLHGDGVESKIPGATWLPVICQNPATKPLVWPTPRRNRKLLLTALIVVLALICGVAVFTVPLLKKVGEYSPQPEQFALYENDKHGVKLNYPKTWQSENRAFPWQDNLARFILKENNGSTTIPEVKIQVYEYQQRITLDDYTRENVTDIRNRSGSKIQTGINETQLGGSEARKLIYTESNGTIKIMEIWTQRGNEIYVFKYIAPTNLYDKFIDDVDIIVNSFELKYKF